MPCQGLHKSPIWGGQREPIPSEAPKKRNKEQSRNKRARRRGIVVDAYGDNNEDAEEDEGEEQRLVDQVVLHISP